MFPPSEISTWTSEIAAIAGLKPIVSASVIDDPSTMKREALETLASAGLCPEDERSIHNLPPAGDEEWNRKLHLTAIVDTLGEYRPATRKIVVYDRMCRLAAASLHIDLRTMKKIVVIHELCHLITHAAEDNDNHIWYHFEYANADDKELFAQIYSLLYFKKKKDKQCENVFRSLADHQSDLYNSWRRYENARIDDINFDLLVARKKPLLHYGMRIEQQFYGWPIAQDALVEISRDGRIEVVERDWLELPHFSEIGRTQVSVSPSRLTSLDGAATRLTELPSEIFGPLRFLGGCAVDFDLNTTTLQRTWRVNCNVSDGTCPDEFSVVLERLERILVEMGLSAEVKIESPYPTVGELFRSWFGSNIELANAFGFDLEHDVVFADRRCLHGLLEPAEARTRIASRMKLECERRRQIRGDKGRRTDARELTKAGERMYALIYREGMVFGDSILEKLASLYALRLSSSDRKNIQQHVELLEHSLWRGVRVVDLPGISAWRRFFDAVSWMYTLENAESEYVASAFQLVEADYADVPLHLQLLAKVMATYLEFRIDVDGEVSSEVRILWKEKKIKYHGHDLTMDKFIEWALRYSWKSAMQASYYCLGGVFSRFLEKDLENWNPQLN